MNLQLQYIFGNVVTYPPGATFGPRRLQDYELVWIIEGNTVYHAEGQEYAAPPGSMVLCRQGSTDGFIWDQQKQTRHAFFHFLPTALPTDWPAPTNWPMVRTMPDADIVRPLFRYVLAFCRAATTPNYRRLPPTPMVNRAVETLLSAVIIGPLDQVTEYGQELPAPVTRALEAINQGLARDAKRSIQLRDLAKAAGVTGEHLCRLFRQHLHAGPMESVWLYRLDKGVQLLARSNLSVKEVAFQCGFASPYHFSRKCKQTYGEPPGALRAKVEAGLGAPSNPFVRMVPRGKGPISSGGKSV